MNCEFCQSPVHIWFDCPKKPTGWKPARLAKKREPAPSSDCKSDALTKEGLAAASSNLGAPTKSTAALMEVPRRLKAAPERSGKADQSRVNHKPTLTRPLEEAGTQALPVDATAGSSNGRTAPFDGVNAGSTPAPASKAKFNRAEWYRNYMKLYMRDRRAKEREAK